MYLKGSYFSRFRRKKEEDFKKDNYENIVQVDAELIDKEDNKKQ